MVHYEFSLILALGVEKYLKMGNRQCYYSNAPEKQKKIIALLEQWQHDLNDNQLFDPMVTQLTRQSAKYAASSVMRRKPAARCLKLLNRTSPRPTFYRMS